MQRMGIEKNEKDFEKCVVCQQMTDERKDEPIKNRRTYYPGVGQMCVDCCRRLYHTDDLRMMPELWGEFES